MTFHAYALLSGVELNFLLGVYTRREDAVDPTKHADIIDVTGRGHPFQVELSLHREQIVNPSNITRTVSAHKVSAYAIAGGGRIALTSIHGLGLIRVGYVQENTRLVGLWANSWRQLSDVSPDMRAIVQRMYQDTIK